MSDSEPRKLHFPFDGAEARALKEYLLRRTLPVFGTSKGREVLIGTGSLFRTAHSRYLVTAAHVFDHIERGSLGLPDGRQNATVWAVGRHTVIRVAEWKKDDLDVALVRLEDESIIARLESEWVFLDASDIGSPDMIADQYFVSGLPETYSSVGKEQTNAGQVLFVTERIGTPANATQPVSVEYDLFFALHPQSFDLATGEYADTPSLAGVSGACVWAVTPTIGAVWSLESQLKVVAIQSAERPGKYMRAKSWRIVEDGIRGDDARHRSAS